MKDIGFFLGFFGLILVLGIASAGRGGIFSKTASSTAERKEQATSTTARTTQTQTEKTEVAPEPKPVRPTKKLTNDQVERRVVTYYRDLDELSEDVRETKLRSPASPHAGEVELKIGSARSTDPKRENLFISANKKNVAFVNVSNWYVVSLVTEESAAIPTGDRIIERWRAPIQENILLRPGEEAYLMTGESPIGTSFRENRCTGYLSYYEEFTPALARSCPKPMDEMERFADIKLDNDTCYDFVERIRICQTPDEDTVESDEADLNGACRSFIQNTLNHDDCVEKHATDPFFDDVGRWRIYFERNEDLWRSEREILRLMDEHDFVVDVIEY